MRIALIVLAITALLVVSSCRPPDEPSPDLSEMAQYFLSPERAELIEDTGYVAFPPEVYEAAQERLRLGITGSSFQDFEPGDSVLEAVKGAK